MSFAGSSSAWVKDGNLILRVQTGEVDQSFGGVSLFELDGPNRLRSIQRADRISVADPGRWRMHNVATHALRRRSRRPASVVDEVTMRSTVNPDFLGLAATDPDLLTLRGLASYIDHLRRNSLDTASYEIGYWSRIARMFAVIVVTLLALPFVFGPLRTTGAGTRTVIGVMLGVVFFLITRTVENGGQLFGLNPGAGRLAADRRDRHCARWSRSREPRITGATTRVARQSIVQRQVLGIEHRATARRAPPAPMRARPTPKRSAAGCELQAACPTSVTARRRQARMPKVWPLRIQLSR